MRVRLALSLGMALCAAGLPMAQAAPPDISLELRDAPLHAALRQIFDAAGVQYQIDNGVEGFATLRIRDQPFESALKLLLRSASVPLTYRIENGVYIVSVRRIGPPSSLPAPEPEPERSRALFEIIPLTYLDPMDLEPLFGPFLTVTHFNRQMGRTGQGAQQGQNGSGRGNGSTGFFPGGPGGPGFGFGGAPFPGAGSSGSPGAPGGGGRRGRGG